MSYMFNEASYFIADLSRWCVTKLTTKPGNFDRFSKFAGQDELQPKWGTCP